MKSLPPGRLVDIGGRRLHLDARGKGKPVVVLEAGIAASSLSWCLIQDRLAAIGTAVSYDRAGLGWSDAAPHSASALDSARDLALTLERAGLDPPFILVGHSFGGLVVRVFEELYPERVAGLVLLDPVTRAEWREMGDARRKMLARGVALSRRGAVLARLGIVGFALRLLTGGSRRIPKLLARVSAGKGAGVTERLTGEVRKMPKELWPAIAAHWSKHQCFRAMADALESLPASVRQLDEARRLGHLPVTILSAGTASPLAMGEHERDAGLSERGDHIVIPRAGHWLQLDAADAVVEAVARVIGLHGAQ